MKKLFSLILACVMLLGLCGCMASNSDRADNNAGNSSAVNGGGNVLVNGNGSFIMEGGSVSGGSVSNEQGVFTVGYGKSDITPGRTGLKIQGSGNVSTGVASKLYAICIAVTDANGDTALIMSLDSQGVMDDTYSNVRNWVKNSFGIPQDNVIISCIHQHSTPEINYDYYGDVVEFGMREAITNALLDQSAATMYINTVQTSAMNFVRRYVTTKGNIVTDNYNELKEVTEGLARHESDADADMQLLKFDRGEGKAPIILVNFQCHPHMGYKLTEVHSDWPGVMRDQVEKELGANVMYVAGAGANVNSNSRIDGELAYDEEDWQSHGLKAAQYVIGAESSYTQVNSGDVKAKFVEKTYNVDHSMDNLLADAQAVVAAFEEGETQGNLALATHTKISSIHHAIAVIEKCELGETITANLGAISIGDVVFTSHEYEMFDTNGMELKDGTVGNANYAAEDQAENPYEMTVVMTIANGNKGYIPSKLGYTNIGYETCVTQFAAGSGEALVTDYLEILQELHGE